MSHTRKAHYDRLTLDKQGREHLNPVQFAANPLGAQNLYGYKARDFSGEYTDPAKYDRAIGILWKAVGSSGSQRVHRIRRSQVTP